MVISHSPAKVLGWSPTEQNIARRAFDVAYKREIDALTHPLRHLSESISCQDDIWRIHDFLSTKRHQIDGRYNFDYNSLLFLFAELIQDNLLDISELEGFNNDKLIKITSLTQFR